MTVTARLAHRGDAEAVRGIYNPEVLESTVTFDLVPRSLDEQVAWIDDHSGGHPAVVAVEPAGEVVGFGSLTPYRPRPAYAPTVEDSVYVHREWRGRGVGVVVLDELVRLALAHGFHSVIAGSSAATRPPSRCTPGAASRRSGWSVRWDASWAAGSTWCSCNGCCSRTGGHPHLWDSGIRPALSGPLERSPHRSRPLPAFEAGSSVGRVGFEPT